VNTIHVVGAAIIHDDRCLVAQRGTQQSLAGKWEFPGGKIEPGELPHEALRREIEEELGVVIAVGPELGMGDVVLGNHRIVLDVYAATVVDGQIEPREHSRVVWATADELSAFDWAPADVPIVAHVASWLRSR
jgi:8-oxo-dGTP diphosphatase